MEDKNPPIVLPLTYILLGGINIDFLKREQAGITDSIPNPENLSFVNPKDEQKT